MIRPYRKYCHSGEINFLIEKKDEKIQEIKQIYRQGKMIEIDGLRVDFKDWWFLLRSSNTEPVLRLVIEAKELTVLEEKKKELIKIIDAPILDEPLIYKAK